MLKKLILALLLFVGLIATANYALFSAEFEHTIDREITTPPAACIAAMQDLSTWDTWSPWSKKEDPDCVFEFKGEPGVGMVWNWSEGKSLGTGTMSITRVTEDAVDYHIDLIAPMKMSMDGGAKFTPREGGHTMTWWSKGANDFPVIGRIMGKAMEGQILSDYETAAEGLDTFAKAAGKPDSETVQEPSTDGK